MNVLKRIFIAVFLVVTGNAHAAGDCPVLSGQYTIGKSESADFASLNEAVNALKCGGINAPTSFLIEDGVYNERLVISSIPGADQYNTVTFESKSGNYTEVVLSYATSDATLVLNGTSFVTFQNMTIDHKSGTYGNAARIDGKAGNINFKGVVFEGVEVGRSGANNNATVYFTATAPKTSVSFEDCELNNGSFGIHKSGMDTANPDRNTTITACTFFNQYEAGLVLVNEEAPMVTNNVVSSVSDFPGFRGISLDNTNANTVVTNNIINAANGSVGLAMNNCVGTPGNMGQISNNSIAVGGTGESYGVFLTGATDNQVLNFNRVKLTISGKQNNTQAFYKNSGTGNNINMLTNIFYDLNTGGYTIVGNTYKDLFNQLPAQSNPSLSVSANGIMIEKVSPVRQ